MSRQEWARSVAAEQIEHQRNIEVRALESFDTLDEQLQRTNDMENAIRHFLGPPGNPHRAAGFSSLHGSRHAPLSRRPRRIFRAR